MTHDPLCHGGDPAWTECATCALIARVREDQNQADTRMRTMFYEQGERDGYAAALRDAIRVLDTVQDEAESGEGIVVTVGAGRGSVYIPRDKAVAAIEALGGQR